MSKEAAKREQNGVQAAPAENHIPLIYHNSVKILFIYSQLSEVWYE